MLIVMLILYNAACPGGEEAVLKTVGCKWLAGSNPVRSAKWRYDETGIHAELKIRCIMLKGSNPFISTILIGV